MPKGIDLDELEKQAKKILDLLEEPEPGFLTWSAALEQALREMKELIEGAGL